MRLQEIRQADENQLQQAVRDLISLQSKLTLGEMHAMTQTIYNRAKKINACINTLNKIARGES